MARVKDLTNKKFGKLTVVNLLPTRDKHGQARWRCRCECGGWVPHVLGGNLRKGCTASCGCESRRKSSERAHKMHEARRTHGLSGQTGNAHNTRWANIKQRTSNPNNRSYANYGGRGIKMYPVWFNDFIVFKAWLDDNLGPCPEGSSLDRIDNDGHYEPNNLRWATAKQQKENQR